jgi:hypothetical protein
MRIPSPSAGKVSPMARRPISSRLHGVLDYTTGAALVAAPAVLGLRGTAAGRILRAAGVSHAGYAALTRSELGVVRVVPYRAHLAIDAAAAVGLAASPWVFGTARSGRAHWLPHVVLGVYELTAVALSDPGGDAAQDTATAPAPGAGDPADDPTGRRVVPNAAQGAPAPLAGGSGTGPGSAPPAGGLQE